MQSFALIFTKQLVPVLLISSAGAAPLAGPPRALDPALSAIAPEHCLWYMASAGMEEADLESSNHTEQLLAEPEIAKFGREIESQILRAIRRASGPDASKRVLASELPSLIKILLTHPVATYLEEVQVGEEKVEISAGFVLSAGEERASIEDSLARLLQLKGEDGPPISTETVGGETWHVIDPPQTPRSPSVRWGWHNNYFVLAVGDGTAEKILQRMEGSAPAWLDDVRREHPVDRESSLGYLNVAAILERVKPFAEEEKAWEIIEKLGLTSIEALHGVSGFDAEGCTSMAHLVTDGRRSGLLALLPHKPLSKRDLQAIPKDALLAAAKRVDVSEFWEVVVGLVSEFQPRAREKVDRALWEMENELGVNIKKDLIDSLGDVGIAYVPGGDLLTSWIGSAAAFRVKDADRLEKALAKLMVVAQKNMPRSRRGGVTIRNTEVDGQPIHFVNVVGEPFPFAPAWCVTDEWLIFGLMPQTVRSVLERQAGDSLADVPEVRELLDARDGPSIVFYQDTPRLVRSLYPLLQMLAQVASTQLQKEGIDVDISLLPSVETVVKHLRPGVSTLTHSGDGFHCVSRHSLPSGGSSIGAAPVAVALLLPAAQAARHAARTNSELNNMKQIALAFHNYADSRKGFPTNIYSKEGKPLLSWRVAILPYLEGGNLYDQFHLDEPWDSEHNLRLVRRMPQVYWSPTGGTSAEAGNTRYVGLVCDESIFRVPRFQPESRNRPRGVRFAGIRDGTSNTLMVVRSAPGYSVPWTKPEDIEYDKDKPFAHLESPEGFFMAAICDGSCRRISLGIGKETMRALVTRAGAEVIDRDAFQMPPRPR